MATNVKKYNKQTHLRMQDFLNNKSREQYLEQKYIKIWSYLFHFLLKNQLPCKQHKVSDMLQN